MQASTAVWEDGVKRRLNAYRDGKAVRPRTGLPSIHRNGAFHREIRRLEKLAKQNMQRPLPPPRLIKRAEIANTRQHG